MSGFKEIGADEFPEAVSSGPVVVDFDASWCRPCLELAPLLEEIAEEFSERVSFYKIDFDENREFTKKHDIAGLPTLFYYKDGELIDRTAGLLEKGELENKLIALL